MAKRIGTLKRIFLNFKNSLFYLRKRDTFVGSDQFGNRYFESEEDSTHNLRKARYIEERKNLDMDEVPEIPPEWHAWLRYTRKDPPTLEEIEQNRITMLKTKLRATELDKKFSGAKAAQSIGDRGQMTQMITEDVHTNPKNTPWPVYEEFEKIPGLQKKQEDR